MRPPMAVIVVLVLLAGWPAAAAAQAPAPAKPQTASLDSEAPPGAPPHWLPNEPWVMQHWIPYDETRLYRLLGSSRGDVWRWLRDDTRSLADLARAKSWDPADLARELVAPWRGRLREPARLATLERRALRTLTQGHLAQHIFFHSLHQDAIPDNAPAIFGVRSRTEFAALRRAELSPLQICRLNGLPGSHARKTAEATLRAMARRAVEGQAMPASQARRLLARQLRQVPRWLQQTRYNGPPPLKTPRASVATASNYSNNAALSADGDRIVYERYDAALATAKRRGEIGVMGRSLGAAAPPAIVSEVPKPWDVPESAYNPAVSADGRWVAFESAEGNLNFAKRYGQMRVYLRDLARGVTAPVSHPTGLAVSRSAYNPTVSGDGAVLAYEAYDRPDSAAARTDVIVHWRASGRTQRIPWPDVASGAPTEPKLSADGRSLAFTATDAGGRSRVYVRRLWLERTYLVSEPGEEAWEPSISATGSTVAYTAAGARGRSRVVIAGPGGRRALGAAAGGLAFEPSLSGDGRRVAFVTRAAADRRTRVEVADLRTGERQLVSRGGGAAGAPSQGSASHPAISGDGRRVAFTSDAWDLSPAKCNSARGIFVRDLDSGATTLVSQGDGGNRYRGPTKGSSTGADAFISLLCGGRAPAAAV